VQAEGNRGVQMVDNRVRVVMKATRSLGEHATGITRYHSEASAARKLHALTNTSTSLVDLAETLGIFSSSLPSHLVWFERVPEASLNASRLPRRSELAIYASTSFFVLRSSSILKQEQPFAMTV
jgi:hypothetical protein